MNQIHPTSEISSSVELGEGINIWHYSQVNDNCIIGDNVNIGRGVYIDSNVSIGANCKIQNNALIYGPSILEEGVFIGPGVIFTNDRFPRSINSDGTKKTKSDWKREGITVRAGASIGAGSVCIAPIEIGAWSVIASGSTVTKNIHAFSLVLGTPAKRVGWVGKCGFPLQFDSPGIYVCPDSGKFYFERDKKTLVELED